MAYCTLTDIQKKLPLAQIIELTDDDGSGEVDATNLNEAISRAEQEIDLFLGKVYDLPLDPVPTLVVSLASELVVYYLYTRTHENIPPARIWQYRNALSILQKIGQGELQIGVTPPEASYEGVSVSNRTQVFDEDTLDKF